MSIRAEDLPFADVKYPRSFDDHRMQSIVYTLLGHVLQRPIPIVVVVRAKLTGAPDDITPNGAIECEAHIVLTTNPGYHLHLPAIKRKQTRLAPRIS